MLVAIASLLAASSAHGAVTIGSSLATPGNDNMPGCNIPCTTANLSLIAANQAPGGLVSPTNGTVTSWRVGSGSSGNLVSLRVLRPGPSLSFTGVGTSAFGTTVSGIAGPFPASLPIQAGDSIGLDNPNAALVLGVNPGASQVYWNLPPLADGTIRTGTPGVSRETLVQAVVEPDNVLTIQRIARNKKKGLARLSVSVPNGGTLVLGGILVKVGGPSTIADKSTIQLTVKAKGKKAKQLKKTGKVGVKPLLTFTPTFGAARTQAVKLKLKRRTKKKR